jgi:hypothetical protein
MTHPPHVPLLALRAEVLFLAALSVFVCVAASSASQRRQCEADAAPLRQDSRWDTQVQVKVVILGGCPVGKTITVVINGNEREKKTLEPKLENGDSTATFQWVDKRDGKFPASPLFASLRLGGTRTYCRIAKEGKPGKDMVPVALFEFSCDEQTADQVELHADSMDRSVVPVTYVRRIGASPYPSDDDFDCDSCVETGAVTGTRSIRDVWFPTERVLLQIGSPRPNAKAPGLLVFSTETKIPGLLAFSADPKTKGLLVAGPNIKLQQPLQRLEKSVEITLARNEIVKTLFVQRAKNGDFSSPAIVIDEKALEKLTYMHVTVVKR